MFDESNSMIEGQPADLAAAKDAFESAAGFVNAQHGRLVAATVWLLGNETEWMGDGLWTPEAYIRWRTGVGAAVASKIADVARRATEFPVSVAMLQSGELSLDQIAPIVRHAPGWADAEIGRLAAKCTVAQISKVAREYRWDSNVATEPQPEPDPSSDTSTDRPSGTDEPTPPADEAWFGWGDDGRFRLRADVAADTGMLLEAALTEARDAQFHAGNPNVDTVDALVEIANRSLGAVDAPARRNRFRVNIHVDRDDRPTDGRGRPLDQQVVDRITCDALVSPVAWENGAPVSVGRTQHIVPDRTRRIVEHRDGGCRVPGCHTDRFVEVHHIVHWSAGGATDTYNLICLCPRHHRLHHQGRLGIVGHADTADGVEFRDGHGIVLTDVAARPGPVRAAPPPIDGTWHHPIGERLHSRWVSFTKPRVRPTSQNPVD